MKSQSQHRRKFLKDVTKASGILVLSPFAGKIKSVESTSRQNTASIPAGKVKFSVININHPHIYGMTDAIKRGGGELVSVYAKEPDLLATFVKTYPDVKLAKNENEILEDASIHLVLSSGIPDERSALGIRVMQHGKDYLSDKPGIITLNQLKEVKKVQKETKRIYSIMYSERLENKATENASSVARKQCCCDIAVSVLFNTSSTNRGPKGSVSLLQSKCNASF